MLQESFLNSTLVPVIITHPAVQSSEMCSISTADSKRYPNISAVKKPTVLMGKMLPPSRT